MDRKPFHKILIVCMANICRSPSAEIILQSKCSALSVSSAGLKALRGKSIEVNASKQLSANGYHLNNHVAQQLNAQMIQESDLVLVMERYQQQQLMRDYPAHSGKVMLLGQWLGNQEINDPYGKSDEAFALVFRQMEQACDTWSHKLNKL
ncbi:MAG: low molecular weight protein-tyrosine-phosphatase [Porticoccaceae bacterium]